MAKTNTLPKAEPALVRAVTVALAFLASLGVSWAAGVDSQTVTILALVLGLVLPILQGLWTRFVVTPKAQVVAKVSRAGRVVAGDAAVADTGAVIRTDAHRTGTAAVPPGVPVAVLAVKPGLVSPNA